jgi:carboxymethylenebutenolidase
MKKKYIYIFIGFVSLTLFYFYFNDLKRLVIKDKNSNFMNEVVSAKYEVLSSEVNYFENRTGFYAEPKTPGDYPGIIMIHEWWGLNDHIKESAKTLSAQGYRVLAVDLFGSVAATPVGAIAQTKGLDQEKAIENMKAAKKFLSSKGSIKIGSLGWCFGGAQSLQIAVNEKLDATVIYYGDLIEDKEKLKKINSPVLGIFGATDAIIPVEKVNLFGTNLKELNIQNEIKIYDGVGHAFANPTGLSFAPNETKDAWIKTLDFLNKNLKK